MSEIMTILIHFHQSNYRNFYLEHVMTHLRKNFQAWSAPVELIPSVIVPLTCAVPAWAHAQVSPSLTPLRLPCARIQYHKTFAGLARRGKTSTGTLIVNDRGELLDFVLTPGNVNPCPQACALTLLRRQGIPIAVTNSFNVQLITSIRANIAHAAAR
jgi:hypothetical protein